MDKNTRMEKGQYKTIEVAFVCLLLVISPFAMAEEIASLNNTKENLNASIDGSDEIEWQVVWQDENGTVSDRYGDPQLIPFIIMAAYAIYTAYTTIDDIKQGDYVSAIVGLLPQGKAIKVGERGLEIIKSMEKTKNRLKVGLETEKKVIMALQKTGKGYSKNTLPVQAIDPVTGQMVRTIPDYINHYKKEVGEIKDYSDVLSNIKQIRAQMAYA